MRTHLHAVRKTWSEIKGNDLSQPGAFYFHLLNSLDPEPESSKVARVRAWLAVRMVGEEASLVDITKTLDTMVALAENLGMQNAPPGGHDSINTIGPPGGADRSKERGKGHKNNCERCTSNCCWSNKLGGRSKCSAFNSSVAIPEEATPGEKKHALASRQYVKDHPGTSTLKGVTLAVRAKPAVNAVGGADAKAGDRAVSANGAAVA